MSEKSKPKLKHSLKKLEHKFKYLLILIFNWIKKFHKRMSSITEFEYDQFEKFEARNLYQVFWDWLTKYFLFGILFSTIFCSIFGWGLGIFFRCTLATGLGLWMVKEIIFEIGGTLKKLKDGQ